MCVLQKRGQHFCSLSLTNFESCNQASEPIAFAWRLVESWNSESGTFFKKPPLVMLRSRSARDSGDGGRFSVIKGTAHHNCELLTIRCLRRSGVLSVRADQVDVAGGVGREPCELARREEARRLRRVGARGVGGVRA